MGDYKSDKKHAKFFSLKLNIRTDADIIAHLETQPSIQGYVKQLIRADIIARAARQEPPADAPAPAPDGGDKP